jgi:hypothetical protein
MCGPAFGERQQVAAIEVLMMNRQRKLFRELDDAINELKKLVSSEGMGLVRDERVTTAIRELDRSRKGGQLNAERLVRAVTLISAAASEQFLR